MAKNSDEQKLEEEARLKQEKDREKKKQEEEDIKKANEGRSLQFIYTLNGKEEKKEVAMDKGPVDLANGKLSVSYTTGVDGKDKISFKASKGYTGTIDITGEDGKLLFFYKVENGKLKKDGNNKPICYFDSKDKGAQSIAFMKYRETSVKITDVTGIEYECNPNKDLAAEAQKLGESIKNRQDELAPIIGVPGENPNLPGKAPEGRNL